MEMVRLFFLMGHNLRSRIFIHKRKTYIKKYIYRRRTRFKAF